MSDQWEFYFTRIDDQVASIFVDLGIEDDAPVAAYPVVACVFIRMRQPRPDGLSSQEEYETLIRLEDALSSALTAGGDAQYVGRNTSNGRRDLYFYRTTQDGWKARVDDAMRAFPEYEYRCPAQADPEWSTYQEFLLPGDRERETISNHHICAALQERGDALTAAREIDHWAYFPDEASRARYVDAAAVLGFKVRTLWPPDETNEQYGAQVFRVDTPAFDLIDDITLSLFDAAREAGGDYDGWETLVVTGSH